MNDKLDCNIVQDLLPAYIDGLTSSKTNEVVKEHLESCAGCSDTFKRMTEPEPEGREEDLEVDYLKKVRRHSGKLAAVCTVCAVVIIALLLFIKIFIIGSPIGSSQVALRTSLTENKLTVSGSLTDSGIKVTKVTCAEKDGVVDVKVYTAPSLFGGSGEFYKEFEFDEAPEEIMFDGLTTWQNGIAISQTAAKLYNAKNPYVGDMPANNNIANILGISNIIGKYTTELTTSQQPYVWTLIPGHEFENTQKMREALSIYIKKVSCILLASVENLDQVNWTISFENSTTQAFSIDTAAAADIVKSDIKEFSSSPSGFEKLLNTLDFFPEQWMFTGSGTIAVTFTVENRSDSEIYGIGAFCDTEFSGESSGVTHADGSAFGYGEKIQFVFDVTSISSETSASSCTLSFSVTDANGEIAQIAVPLSVTLGDQTTKEYILTGNFADGFTLEPKN